MTRTYDFEAYEYLIRLYLVPTFVGRGGAGRRTGSHRSASRAQTVRQ